MALLWAAGLSLFAVALFEAFSQGGEDTPSLLLLSAGMVWAGLLLVPSVATSFARLLNKPLPTLRIFRAPANLIVAILFVGLTLTIIAGRYLIENGFPLLLSPFHVLGATLSVAILVWLAVHNLELGSTQRRWGSFASGLTLGPVMATLLELLAGFVVLFIAIIYISTNPQLSGSLDALGRSLQTVGNNPEALLPAIQRFASDPVIAGLLLANFSLAVPMIEEIVKPIAVWILMWKRVLTPAQGFGLGAISGAGFAIAENLFSGATVAGWAETTFVRFGATAFHIATAGLMGWALVQARNQKRYLLVPVVYAFNIVIHGLWNGVVVLGAFTSLPEQFSVASSFVLLGITTLSVLILYGMNRQLSSVPIVLPPAKPAKRSSKIKTRR